MPLQNRVTPEGAIVATPQRGLMYGNRGGCFHRDDGSLKQRPYASKQWICCVLSFKGRRRTLRQPGRFTELFFLDEATAFATGHRPCYECRRADAVRFAGLWAEVHKAPRPVRVPGMDQRLHSERIGAGGNKPTFSATLKTLPTGTFVRTADGPCLLWDQALYRWSFDGYQWQPPITGKRPFDVLTPRAIVDILAHGYQPLVHPSVHTAAASKSSGTA